jgi:hypothetical protein
MKVNIPPAMIAAGIAGAGFGAAAGFMTKGEELENMGASGFKQVTGSAVGGITHGVAGAGIGVGVAGTTMALKKILGK